MTDWQPATEAESALRDALRAGDQELYFRILSHVELLLPVSAGALSGQAGTGWGTWTSGGRTHVLAFTSQQAMSTCLAEHGGAARRMAYADLAGAWPNPEWWLAINPGLPIEGYLPAWFVAQLSRGDVRLPGRTIGARARVEAAAAAQAGGAPVPMSALAASAAARAAYARSVPQQPGAHHAPDPPTRTAPTGRARVPAHAAPDPEPEHEPRRLTAIPPRPIIPARTVAPPRPPMPPMPPGPSRARPAEQPGWNPAGPLPVRTPAEPAAHFNPVGTAAPPGPPAPAARPRVIEGAVIEGAVIEGAVIEGAVVEGAVIEESPPESGPTSATAPLPSRPRPPEPAPVPAAQRVEPAHAATPARSAYAEAAPPTYRQPPASTRVEPARPTYEEPPRPTYEEPPRPTYEEPPGYREPAAYGKPAGSGRAEPVRPGRRERPGEPTRLEPAAEPVRPESTRSGRLAEPVRPEHARSERGAERAFPPAAGSDPAAATARAEPTTRPERTPRTEPATRAEPTARAEPATRAEPAARPDPATRAARFDPAARSDPAAQASTATRTGPAARTDPTAREDLAAGADPAAGKPPEDPDFTPANAVETELLAAAGDGQTDHFLSTLLLAKVLIPIPPTASPTARPGEPGFAWRREQVEGQPYVVVFTSTQRMTEYLGGETDVVEAKFVQLIGAWPDESWSFAVNPGTPVGATLPGVQIKALAAWAAEVGLTDQPAVEVAPVEEPAAPTSPAPAKRPVVMQKPITPAQVRYYLDRGYDRVSGFVQRASEVEHLTTPDQLYEALGLGYPDSPFKPDDDEFYLLRWTAYRPDLYRIPFGGRDETSMRAMQGWVIERAPFRGNGFAPGESADVIAEFKVDSARLPHGAQMWRMRRGRKETLVALLDADGPRWRPIGPDNEVTEPG